MFRQFNTSANAGTIFVSKIGDNAIDLPSANVIIQISSHFASRRQEAQRLGRILRPKENNIEKYNAYYYSLVSTDTRETYYSTKRQRFLVEQGYAFKVLDNLVPPDAPGLACGTKQDRRELLLAVMAKDVSEGTIEEGEFEHKSQTRRVVHPSLANMSGPLGGLYAEQRMGRGIGGGKKVKVKHAMFRKREEQVKIAKKAARKAAEAERWK